VNLNKYGEMDVLPMKIISPYGHCEYAFEHDKFGYYIHIYNLFIYKKHRGKGKARELLQKTINEITASGWTEEIQIVADPNDPTVNK